VRTTIDLPEDLHRIARSIAGDENVTLSEAVARLMRRGLGQGRQSDGTPVVDDGSGLPTVRLGVPITSEDVRSADDEG
jgi:hypothetical protein